MDGRASAIYASWSSSKSFEAVRCAASFQSLPQARLRTRHDHPLDYTSIPVNVNWMGLAVKSKLRPTPGHSTSQFARGNFLHLSLHPTNPPGHDWSSFIRCKIIPKHLPLVTDLLAEAMIKWATPTEPAICTLSWSRLPTLQTEAQA